MRLTNDNGRFPTQEIESLTSRVSEAGGSLSVLNHGGDSLSLELRTKAGELRFWSDLRHGDSFETQDVIDAVAG